MSETSEEPQQTVSEVDRFTGDPWRLSPQRKRRRSQDDQDAVMHGSSSSVAQHYNAVPEKGIVERTYSRIYYLRNFNNWMKSMLIGEFLERLKDEGCPHASVLDLCCGKGGDLLKWRVGEIKHLVATDIASISMEQCESRYEQMKARSFGRPLFTADFIVADATEHRLRDRYEDGNIRFDLCSCQFSLHYSFESEKKARRMIQNAIERVRPGGYFIGTLPDAERIMYCLRSGENGSYANDVVQLDYKDKDSLAQGKQIPIFGAQFHFTLDTQVNCPEYLVHFPVLEKLLADCGFELVYRKSFPNAFNDFLDRNDGRGLLSRMQALETYPPDQQLSGKPESYEAAEKKRKEIYALPEDRFKKLGTLSKDEWEVAAMYLVFAFRRKMPSC